MSASPQMERKLDVLADLYEGHPFINRTFLATFAIPEQRVDEFFERALTFVSDPDKWRERWPT